jgi:anaerobic C4-dicarboxylate transporter DcuA
MSFLLLAVFLICIFIGSRMSGIILGMMGMTGLILQSIFNNPLIICV